ncbi:MAG: ribosomal protein S18-alanine N-acetyltransferase [Anaerolineales bacterium]
MTNLSVAMPAVQFAVRPMRPEDLPEVCAIDALSFTLPWPPRSFEFELNENPASLCTVIEAVRPGELARIVGMAVTWLIVDEAHIATFAVHPDFRGQGVGRRLLKFVLQSAAQHGAVVALLEVRESNYVAQALYRAFGFEVVGSRARYYQDNGEAALLMTLFNLPQQLENLVEA